MHDVAGAGGVSYRPSMHTMTPLISTLVGAFVAAFVFGLIANRLRVAPIAGFLVAGIVIGPFTPGFVADPHLAPELAEIGVILLMFGVGLHFSLADLLAVRRVAVPGAIAQILLATALGAGLATFLGWELGARSASSRSSSPRSVSRSACCRRPRAISCSRRRSCRYC